MRTFWLPVKGTMLVALAGLLLVAAVTSAQEGPIYIGAGVPLSQPGAVQAGVEMRWAMQQAVDDINARGGVLGRELRLIAYDTANQPHVAEAAARRLVEDDKVVAVVGYYHSGAALAAARVYRQAGIPVVFAEPWHDAVTGGDPDDPDYPPFPPNIFRIAPTSSYASEMVSDWIVNGIKARKVIQLYEAADFGLGQARVLREQLSAAGVELIQVQVELNQPDYSAVLARLAREHPDADVVTFDITGESSYIAEQNAFEVGLLDGDTICLANQVAQDWRAFWRAVPDGVGCVFQLVGMTPAQYNDITRSIAERFEKEFGTAPKVWALEAYDSVLLVADAIERAGSTDLEKVVAALEQTHFLGAQGLYQFPYGSHNPLPAGRPSWLWHQWPNPPIQLVQYTARNQTLAEAAVVWPVERQTHGVPYVEVRR